MGRKIKRRLDEAALNHLLIQYKDRVEELIIRLAWEAGLTRPEIAALEWKDISLDDGLIHLSNRSVHMEDDLRHCLEARYDLFPPPQYPYVVITDGRKMHPCDGHIGLLVAKAMDSEEALFGIRLNDLRDDYIIRLLEKEGISAEVINLRFLKPLDKETIMKSCEKTKRAVVCECGVKSIYNEIATFADCKISSVAVPDMFIPHGSIKTLKKELGLDEQGIYKKVLKEFFGENKA